MTALQHTHGVEELCETGSLTYATALRQGYIERKAADSTPCLIDLGLLHPDPDDTERMLPTPPSLALHAMLLDIESEIHNRRSREVRIVESLERFMALDTAGPSDRAPGVVVLEGLPRINTAISRASNDCRTEALCVQPGPRSEFELRTALPRGLLLRERGAHMRTLYQRASLHSPGLRNYLEKMGHSLEIRSLDDIPERLMIFDRSVAFIPASADRTTALELRHPAMIEYLATVFERFWRQGIPLHEPAPPVPAEAGISERQYAVARLLSEGHPDEAVAKRLGISVRTCRTHIAHLSTVLGTTNRVQLGVRIAQSGMLDSHNRREHA
ncbi:LuxR C-terminal-related transcriptional regulator [Streptomyces sp. NBC_01306]|uniref:helix-turn-helix transcriptional regulator n=1 Tax=Streptomyces sp. NBC_01306 TaxID=2903819 RepID=UPI00225A15EE|nr:LuxR C-terminal-related transcriptional regulator [Streptomyces sp. NBC_01306]MCX4724985.1 LuxR C-terminal-related transcriptional regulator [Streptomyces sp. NBC_01306]